MATTFPTTVDSFATNVDGVSIVTAADMNNVQDAITALETFVGVNPAPTYLNTALALVRRAADGDIAAQDIVAVGQLISTAIGGGTISGLYINSTTPAMALRKSNAAANEKLWDVYLAATQAIVRLVNDAENSATDIITITRTGITGSSVAFSIPVSVAGALVASSGVAAPRSGGSALFALDSTATGSAISIAVDATAQPFGAANNIGGMFQICETVSNGSTALFLTGNVSGAAGVIKVADTNSGFSTTINTASKINVYMASSIVTIQNKTASTISCNVQAFRNRTGA